MIKGEQKTDKTQESKLKEENLNWLFCLYVYGNEYASVYSKSSLDNTLHFAPINECFCLNLKTKKISHIKSGLGSKNV